MSQQPNEKSVRDGDEARLETPESKEDTTQRSESKDGYPTSGAASSDTSTPDPA